MTLTRWSPVSGLSSLAALEIGGLDKMFEATFQGEAYPQGWVPAVDILETADKNVVVKVELPDMKREDIKITLENNVLTIEGERKFENKKDSTTYHRVERGYGAFRRSFTLPSTIDGSNVQATYRDGVLSVTVPRREETRPRQIEVNG
jgi:HSP20 family protein